MSFVCKTPMVTRKKRILTDDHSFQLFPVNREPSFNVAGLAEKPQVFIADRTGSLQLGWWQVIG